MKDRRGARDSTGVGRSAGFFISSDTLPPHCLFVHPSAARRLKAAVNRAESMVILIMPDMMLASWWHRLDDMGKAVATRCHSPGRSTDDCPERHAGFLGGPADRLCNTFPLRPSRDTSASLVF